MGLTTFFSKLQGHIWYLPKKKLNWEGGLFNLNRNIKYLQITSNKKIQELNLNYDNI